VYTLLYQSKILSALNERVQLNSNYTNFQKVFDKINHKILLYKLCYFGIHNNFLNCSKSYLSSSTQAVKISNCISKDFLISSGVPQGLHLCSLLSILFINNFPFIIDSSKDILLFVNNTKIFAVIKSSNYTLKLQANLNTFVEYFNRLPQNIKKCSVLSFSF